MMHLPRVLAGTGMPVRYEGVSMSDPAKFRFSVDRSGTFTDVYAEVPGRPGFRGSKDREGD